MRVVFDHPNPFFLAHGGMQIQIEQTMAALRKVGVDVDYVRWWDASQQPDVIHYVGRPPVTYLAAAQQKGIRVVLAQILTGLGSRSPGVIAVERQVIRALRKGLPWMIRARFAWDAFKQVDACAANTPWEAHLMSYVFDAPAERVHVIPNGVEDVFLDSKPCNRGKWLVCTATITERKRVIETAKAAVRAQTPLWVIGKPYADTDRYYVEFRNLQKQYSEFLRYEGAINDRANLARIYREARGFVLLSTKETRSLAAEEAAACECPLLLGNLPWARSVFGSDVSYCSVSAPESQTASALRAFYDAAPKHPVPVKPLRWVEVGDKLKRLYSSLSKPAETAA